MEKREMQKKAVLILVDLAMVAIGYFGIRGGEWFLNKALVEGYLEYTLFFALLPPLGFLVGAATRYLPPKSRYQPLLRNVSFLCAGLGWILSSPSLEFAGLPFIFGSFMLPYIGGMAAGIGFCGFLCILFRKEDRKETTT